MAEGSFKHIAKCGGVEPVVSTVKHWLSKSTKPWLLIIDNADELNLEVEKYIPPGPMGLTLITTRNTAHRHLGTIGIGNYQFESLSREDASQLLLKVAKITPTPWTERVIEAAESISQTLGALPLALIHAGLSIMKRLCSLEEYPQYHRRSVAALRQERLQRGFKGDINENLKVFTTFEINFLPLVNGDTEPCRDAVEILKICSFLHYENISLDIFLKALEHPRLEALHAREEEERGKEANLAAEARTLMLALKSSFTKKFLVEKLQRALMDQSRPILPSFLQDVDYLQRQYNWEEFKGFFKDRINRALSELDRRSILNYHEHSDSYSMHPLVHQWARERPAMLNSDQAIWCEAATNILAQCVLLPPLNANESYANMPGLLLPHVLTVEEYQARMQRDYDDKLVDGRKKKSWITRNLSLGPPVMIPRKAIRLAKFSTIYAQGGRWKEAEKHQLVVRDYCIRMLGMENMKTVSIMLALAGTYWLQTRSNEAIEILEQVYEVCERAFGRLALITLEVMIRLGRDRCQQARLSDSLTLLEKAISRLQNEVELTSEYEVLLLEAKDSYGLTLYMCFRYNDAKQEHKEAVKGLQEVVFDNPAHLEKLLHAQEHLAIVNMELGKEALGTDHKLGMDILQEALRSIKKVRQERTRILGKEHPFTLLSRCNTSRIHAAMGDLEVAEEIIREALQIAQRTLGDNHLGTIMGQNHLAKFSLSSRGTKKQR